MGIWTPTPKRVLPIVIQTLPTPKTQLKKIQTIYKEIQQIDQPKN
jgi:hypothetical protein